MNDKKKERKKRRGVSKIEGTEKSKTMLSTQPDL
jgi:hypothetical protein